MKKTNWMALGLGVTLALGGCKSAPIQAQAEPASKLTVKTHTAGEPGFLANSHLISGAKDAILVDAQFTRSEARKVAQIVRDSGKNLTAIFITHGHPDHYLGLEVLKKEFPKTRVLATPSVIREIQATAPGKIKYWKQMYKDDLADKFVTPQPLIEGEMMLEGESLQIAEMGPGESEKSAVIYIPSLQTLVAGDLAYNQVHLWLAENRPEGWIKNLDRAKQLGRIRTVLTGHGATAGADVLETNEAYIQKFVEFTKAPAKNADAKEKLKKEYSEYKLPIIADLSVDARVK